MTDNENALVVSPVLHHAPTLFTPTTRAAQRVLEFFTAQINNDHTRKASKPFDIAINFRPPTTQWGTRATLSKSVKPCGKAQGLLHTDFSLLGLWLVGRYDGRQNDPVFV